MITPHSTVQFAGCFNGGKDTQYDVGCLDEISSVSFDQNGVDILKGYMNWRNLTLTLFIT